MIADQNTGMGKTIRALLMSLAFMAPLALASDTDCNCEASEDQAEVKTVYPTPVVVDYVLACMASNGNSFTSLHQCSCSIDLIMSKIPHEDFEKVNTIMQVQLDKGQRGIFYRDSHWAKNAVEVFERVQAESTLKCF